MNHKNPQTFIAKNILQWITLRSHKTLQYNHTTLSVIQVETEDTFYSENNSANGKLADTLQHYQYINYANDSYLVSLQYII